MKILLKIRYLGTRYCGYQVQPNGISIQQKLNEAVRAVFGYECDVVGCSRTDSGVHANGFCAAISKRGETFLETSIPVDRLPLAISAHLPEDISVYGAEEVPDSFHARYDVKAKEYRYRFYNAPVRNPFEEGRSCHVPKPIDGRGLDEMQRAASHLCGTHDFSAYMAQGSSVLSTVRTVFEAGVERENDVIVFRIVADGFLYNMVRILAGTLLDVGQGKIGADEIPSITEGRDRSRAGATMPACGLYLEHVTY